MKSPIKASVFAFAASISLFSHAAATESAVVAPVTPVIDVAKATLVDAPKVEAKGWFSKAGSKISDLGSAAISSVKSGYDSGSKWISENPKTAAAIAAGAVAVAVAVYAYKNCTTCKKEAKNA